MTIEEALAAALVDVTRGDVTFPRDFHGFPGTVHGGAVAALFHRLTLPRPPVRLRMDLRHGVPTEALLRLTTGSEGHAARLALDRDGRRLAEATLSREVEPAPDLRPLRDAWTARPAPRGIPETVPGTATCLACGSANPLGLGVRFRLDERFLWAEHPPRESYRTREGTAHPALATILLDELGWWLGALGQGECGVTTEVAITLFRPIPFAPLLAVGARDNVRADGDPRGRFCRTTGYLLTPEAEVLAAGEVRFAGSRAYTRRLLQPFLEATDLDTLARLFPSAAGLGGPPAPPAISA